MPSSIRPMTTTSGVLVVSEMYPMVARPNAKAIGTAAKTIAPTMNTKKISKHTDGVVLRPMSKASINDQPQFFTREGIRTMAIRPHAQGGSG